MAKRKAKIIGKSIEWRERLVKIERMPASDLLDHPLNPKIHPDAQKQPLEGLLSEVGKVDILKAYLSERNEGALTLWDGHCRRELRPEEIWNVGIYDLTDDEADLLLATFDPIGWQAEQSKQRLESLMDTIRAKNQRVVQFLAGQNTRFGLVSQINGHHQEASDAGQPKATLADRFLVPPFSVLDARQGYWQDRKRAWLALGIQSELGRGDTSSTSARVGPDDAATYRTIGGSKKNGLLGFSEQSRSHYKTAAPGGTLRDAMSLGSDGKTVRGDGAGKPIKGASNLARCFGQDLMRGEHTVGGVTMRLDQRSAAHANGTNKENIPGYYWKKERGMSDEEIIAAYEANGGGTNVSGTSIFDPVLCELAYRWFSPPDGAILDPFAGGSVRGVVASILGRNYTGIDLRGEQIAANETQAKQITPDRLPRWITGDSRDAAKLAAGEYDLVFSCPPYADLEVYSDNPQDLSTMKYEDFLTAYREIIAASVAMLKPNRFACFVVGDIRDKKGFYRNFVSDTISAFQDAGAKLYNEAILVTSVGSLPIRVGRQFEAGRKLGKTHQNVLVFLKGDAKKAVADCGTVEVHDPAESFGEVVD